MYRVESRVLELPRPKFELPPIQTSNNFLVLVLLQMTSFFAYNQLNIHFYFSLVQVFTCKPLICLEFILVNDDYTVLYFEGGFAFPSIDDVPVRE